MRRFQVHPVAIVGGILCFVIGSNLAIFWSQQVWSLLGQEETERERSEEVKRSGEPAQQRDDEPASYPPQGPEPPYQEFVRRPDDGGDDSLAPVYRELPEGCGSIRTEEGGEERAFPPRKTDYRVDIRGDLAAVTVEQTFVNPTESTIDAVYQFPLNRRAAVYAMTMHVGERVVRAQIKEEERAREIYEEADRQGKKAALLSQQRPNWFTQRVANLGAGETLRVTLRYVHPLPKEEGAYQFVVPTQLGERYGDGASASNDLVLGDGRSEKLPEASRRRSAVSIDVRIDAPMEVRKIRSGSHALRLRKYSSEDWRVALAPDSEIPDEHFRLQFELAGEEPEVGLNTHWDEEREEGYFSLLLEPPRRPDPQKISNREIVFVMDTSGSMHGGPLDKSKRFVKAALRDLRRVRDSFRIVQFDTSASQFSAGPAQADEQSVREAIEYVDNIHAGGGTEYRPGLDRALEPETPTGAVRLVVFLTDGKIGYEFEVLRQIREKVGRARLFGVGIGASVNRYLLEEMGRMGRGFARYLGKETDRQPEMGLDEQIDRIVRRIRAPLMTDLRVDWSGLDVSGVSPRPVPDLFGGESVRVHGTYANPGEHTVTVHGTIGADRVSIPVTRRFPASEGQGEAVELSWARQQIRQNMHELMGAKIRHEKGTPPGVYRKRVIELGLEYSLVTQWTSFVAVAGDGEVFGRGARGMGLRGSGSGSGGEGYGTVYSLASVDSEKSRRAGGPQTGAKIKPKKRMKHNAMLDLGRTPVQTEEQTQRDVIRKQIAGRRDEVDTCYKRQLQWRPDVAGKLVVRFTIDETGDVVSASVEESTLDSQSLEQCVLGKVRGWSFPAADEGGKTTVEYPFVFASR